MALFAFPSWLMMLSFFLVLLGPLPIFFGKKVYSNRLPLFKICLLVFVLELQQFFIYTVIRYMICKHFPLMIVFFEVQKFCFNDVQFTFLFCCSCFYIISKNVLPKLRSWRFILIFSPKNFMILALIFKLLTCFELIPEYGLK